MVEPSAETRDPELIALRAALSSVEEATQSRLGQVEERMRELIALRAALSSVEEATQSRLGQVEERMREHFQKQGLELAELQSAVKFGLSIAKWAGALLLLTVLFTGMAGIWW